MAKFPLVFSQLNKEQHWLREREDRTPWEGRLTLCYFSHLMVPSSLDLRIFANEGETSLPCNVLVPQLCIPKSMSCPEAACSFSLIPVKQTTFRIMSVHFQEDAVLTLILRDKYLFGATLFIYPALFFFLDQWEQSTSSFPYWEIWLDLSVSFLTKRNFGFWVLPRATFLFCAVWLLSPCFHSLADF